MFNIHIWSIRMFNMRIDYTHVKKMCMFNMLFNKATYTRIEHSKIF